MSRNIARRLLFQKFFIPQIFHVPTVEKFIRSGQTQPLNNFLLPRAERRKAARAFAAGAWRASCAQAKLEQ